MRTAIVLKQGKAARERGTAVLIVIVLLGCIALLLYANTRTLATLRQELMLLNTKQLVKYGQSAQH
jgi:hypothetical protein